MYIFARDSQKCFGKGKNYFILSLGLDVPNLLFHFFLTLSVLRKDDYTDLSS